MGGDFLALKQKTGHGSLAVEKAVEAVVLLHFRKNAGCVIASR
jgi:hypothetical protein